MPPIIVCNEDHQFLVSNQFNEAGCSYQSIILEPSGKNTAPATTLAALALEKAYQGEDCLMLIMPADHSINDNESFASTIESCHDATEDSLCIFGVEPTFPSQAYGYIKVSEHNKKECQDILAFHEKPDAIKAKEYFESNCYYWNSGIFLLKNRYSSKLLIKLILKSTRHVCFLWQITKLKIKLYDLRKSF